MKKILFFTILLFITSSISSCQTKFDKKVWLELENNDFMNINNPRANMIDDIMNNYLKKGMNKRKVIKLLGKPLSDTIGAYLPKGVTPPDSLRMKNILYKPEEKQEYYIELMNDWFAKNYESSPMLMYPIGWSTMDPISLRIRMNNKDEVVDFWVKQH